MGVGYKNNNIVCTQKVVWCALKAEGIIQIVGICAVEREWNRLLHRMFRDEKFLSELVSLALPCHPANLQEMYVNVSPFVAGCRTILVPPPFQAEGSLPPW